MPSQLITVTTDSTIALVEVWSCYVAVTAMERWKQLLLAHRRTQVQVFIFNSC